MSRLDFLSGILAFKRDLPDKVVDEEYLDICGIRSAAKSEGFDLVWAKPEEVPTLQLEGYDCAYERYLLRWRRRLVDERGLVLLKKPHDL